MFLKVPSVKPQFGKVMQWVFVAKEHLCVLEASPNVFMFIELLTGFPTTNLEHGLGANVANVNTVCTVRGPDTIAV